MYFITTKCVDPKYNLATEEFLVKQNKYKEPILFLWQNDNTIVVGRNQNTQAEINIENVEKDNVTVIRRNTGGGTVYHDLGNMNFSIIFTDEKNNAITMFKETLTPIIETLNKLGAKVEFHGKNDIYLNGKKISGNAMWKWKNRFLQHGTLLFNSNLEPLIKYLNVDKAKLISKNIKSVKSRVTNINDEVSKKIHLNEFEKSLFENYKLKNDVSFIELSKDDLQEIDNLYKTKYCTYDWTFVKNANFEIVNKKLFEGKGTIEVNMNVESNKIKDIKIFGDFLGFQGTEELENALKGIEYSYIKVLNVFEKFNIKKIFGPNFDDVKEIVNIFIE